MLLRHAGLVVVLAACSSRPAVPPLKTRARIVPAILDVPPSCGEDGVEPRRPTDLERRMASRFTDATGAVDIAACRAICRRALGPGEDVVDCFPARSNVMVGCTTPYCREREEYALRRTLYCGESGENARKNPAAAHAAVPFMIAEGGPAVVCDLR